jgi:DNA polymerase-3 subunit epsilon
MTESLPTPRDALEMGVAVQETASIKVPAAVTSGLSFVAFDVETANSRRGSVCAIGACVVREGKPESTHMWLAKPPAPLGHFDAVNMSLHGISPAHVVGQPGFGERLDQLLDLAGELPLVSHNAAFDVGALREACTVEDRPWPTFTYACSLVMARRALDLISYRLPIVADECGVTLVRHHDAGADAAACAGIVINLAERAGAGDLSTLASGLHVMMGRMGPDLWSGCHGRVTSSGHPVPPGAAPDADPAHPLFGQVVVFTGALDLRREDAWQAVAACGATAEPNVTKRTTMLVVGDGFTGDDPAAFHTGKAAKAVKWRAKGHRIEVLTESDLADMLAETHTSGLHQSALA